MDSKDAMVEEIIETKGVIIMVPGNGDEGFYPRKASYKPEGMTRIVNHNNRIKRVQV
jgi:hypothetical protein